VSDTRNDVDNASNRLREFQEKYKIVDLGEQSKAIVSAIAMLRGEMMSKQLQLSYLSSFSSSEEATAQQLRQQLDVMGGQLHSLEEAAPESDDQQPAPSLTRHRKPKQSLFPPAMSVPKLRFELEQLARDQKVQEMVYLLLVQRFELAKVNEARDTSAFQILDMPVTPTDHSRPRRMRWAVAGLFAGLGFGIFFALIPFWRRRYASL
jgi:capsule polysaccharide export protein KpsE/RkpR